MIFNVGTSPLYKILRDDAVPSIFAWTAKKSAAAHDRMRRYTCREKAEDNNGCHHPDNTIDCEEVTVVTSEAHDDGKCNSKDKIIIFWKNYKSSYIFSPCIYFIVIRLTECKENREQITHNNL